MQTSDIGVIDLRPTEGEHLLGQDLLHVDMDVDEVGAVLELLATELRHQWSVALQRGSFDEVSRLTEASHAVHRALVALTPDSVGI